MSLIACQINRIAKARAAETTSNAQLKRQIEAAIAQTNYLAQLASRQNTAWADVEDLVSSRQRKSYDQAICMLRDLREVATQAGEIARFATRLAALIDRHAKKAAFCEMVSGARIMLEPARAC